MSKNKHNKKTSATAQNKPKKTVSKISTSSAAAAKSISNKDLIFGRRNYAFLLAGIGLIVLGYFLMAGGNMPSPDVWDDNIIYSTRRTLIAPIFILAGLGLQVYTIFAKK